MWIAALRSGPSSSEPPLIDISASTGSLTCHRRLPQSGQKAQSISLPLSVARDQTRGSPRTSRSAAVGTMTEIPNADDDCARHSVQWQT